MGISSIQGGMYYQGIRETGAAGVKPGEDKKAADQAKEGLPGNPSYDEYIPSGQSAPEPDKASQPADPDDLDKKKVQHCVANTDKVDQEIDKLKQKKADLEQQIRRAKDDPDKKQELEARLRMVENELAMKDNDAYRKQNTSFRNID